MRLLVSIGVSLVLLARSMHAVESLPLLYADDFEHGMDHWQTTDPDLAKPFWKITELAGPDGKPTHVLRVTGASNYQPKYRSPLSIAWLKDVSVGDFEMTAHVQSTHVDAGAHRDMCFFWGRQDADHFYYVHLGAVADPHACQIFIVDGADRVAITTKSAKGTPWTLGWHNVKVVRHVDDGDTEVYFDEMNSPYMAAKDATFKSGQVGLGTFDDHGNWDDFELRGVAAEPPCDCESKE